MPKVNKGNKRQLNNRVGSVSLLPLRADASQGPLPLSGMVTVTSAAGGRWQGELVDVTGRYGYARLTCVAGVTAMAAPAPATPPAPAPAPVADDSVTITVGADPTVDAKVDIYTE